MYRYATKARLATATLLVLLGTGCANAEQSPDPATLLADMQRALIPGVAQFSRVHISAHSDQPGGGSKDWDALVIRQRDEQGPRNALSLTSPTNLKGAAILTAPHPTKPTLGLWLVTSEEQRVVEFSPLEADRQLLSTRFNFEDVGFTPRETTPPVVLGSERLDGRMTWKVEARPTVDRYYSRMLTWIAADTRLPVRREYYDRAGQLWKIVSYRARQIDGIPTIVGIDLKDVQSRDTASWRVDALAYHRPTLNGKVLSPAGLGDLQRLVFWKELDGEDARQAPARD